MLIGVEKRFVFVANSKAASTSIEMALVNAAEIERRGSAQRKHIILRAALLKYDFLFGQKKYAPETFFKFGVMRDPVEWIQSWYRYRKGNKVAHPLAEGTTFEEFWHQRVAQSKKSGKKQVQRDYFTRWNGEPLIDYIIPYDALPEHFETITTALGINASLPHQNASKIQSLDDPLSKDMLEEIREYFAEDYTLYGQIAEINARGLEHLKATRTPATQHSETGSR